MKKWIALILATVMCLALVACGTPEAAEPQTEETSAPQETAPTPEPEPSEAPATEEPPVEETGEDEVCCALTVTINPEFRLLLNKNGLVLALECLNEDAQNALGAVDVSGMTAAEAMNTVLEALYLYDSAVFSVDQPMITVNVDMYEEFLPLNQAIMLMDETVFGFAETHQIPLGYQRRSAPASEEISTVISESTDENGNHVVVEVDEDGSEWHMVSDSKTGQMLELIRTDPDGTVTRCDMTTNTTTTTKPDGTTTQMQGVIGKG